MQGFIFRIERRPLFRRAKMASFYIVAAPTGFDAKAALGRARISLNDAVGVLPIAPNVIELMGLREGAIMVVRPK